jgi:hypothetical protein
MADPNAMRLEALCEEVARVWEEEADLTIVGSLSAQYPEYAEELRAFAAYLLEDTYVEDDDRVDVPPEVMVRSASRTQALLETEGREILREQASKPPPTSPDPLVVKHGSIWELLCDYIEDPPESIIRTLNLTGRFLRGISECKRIPYAAASALVDRTVGLYSVLQEHRDEMAAVLLQPKGSVSLASARGARPTERLCYADVVRRSGLSPEEVEFWLSLDDEEAE